MPFHSALEKQLEKLSFPESSPIKPRLAHGPPSVSLVPNPHLKVSGLPFDKTARPHARIHPQLCSQALRAQGSVPGGKRAWEGLVWLEYVLSARKWPWCWGRSRKPEGGLSTDWQALPQPFFLLLSRDLSTRTWAPLGA